MTGTLVIDHATALLGEDLTPLNDARVVIVNGVIEVVGPVASIEPPVGRVVDARGLTLVPGFIDTHVHIAFADPSEVLRKGVTTARDLAWPPDLIWSLVERSRVPAFDGPRLEAAGQMLTTAGGYPTRADWAPAATGRAVDSPQAAEEAVAAQADRGACIVKIALNPAAGPVLEPPLVRSIVKAAHKRGLMVTAHTYGLDQLDVALGAEVDELAHMLMSAEVIPDETLERMVRQGLAVSSTLSIRYGRDRQIAIDNLGRFFAAGGKVIYGTDLGNKGPRPGIDKREVAALAKAGMKPQDIVAAATVVAAGWLGLRDRGVIKRGYAADLVGLSGAPLAQADDLTNVALVVKGGKVVKEP